MNEQEQEQPATQDNSTATPIGDVAYDTEMYKGYPMIVLNKGDKFPFQFGYAKAKLILENVDKIRAFVSHQEALKAALPKDTYKRTFKPKG